MSWKMGVPTLKTRRRSIFSLWECGRPRQRQLVTLAIVDAGRVMSYHAGALAWDRLSSGEILLTHVYVHTLPEIGI